MATTMSETHMRQDASTVPENLQTLVSAVREDPDLLPEEKETTLQFANVDHSATLFSEQGGVVRRLLRHPLFDIGWIRVYEETAPNQTMSPVEYTSGAVTAVYGSFPVKAIKLMSRSRSDPAPCKIVSRDPLAEISGEGDL